LLLLRHALIGHEPLSLVETVTILRGPKFSTHAVIADHRSRRTIMQL
jgi:hypothetical protein